MTGRKTLLVTGASAGAGRALTERAVRAGYAVFGVGRRTELLEDIATKLRDAAGEFASLSLELRAPNAAQTIVAAALARFGRIDVLVNNAGAVAKGRISEQSDDALNEQFTVHVAVPLALLREALPSLRAAKGHVFFVGSGVARVPVAGLGAYPSAKAAIRSASRIARNELRDEGIAVTYVDPGAIATEFMTRAGMQGSTGPLSVTPHHVARKILRAVATRQSHVDAVPWQTTLIGVSELVPRLTDAVLAAAPGIVGTQPLPQDAVERALSSTTATSPGTLSEASSKPEAEPTATATGTQVSDGPPLPSESPAQPEPVRSQLEIALLPLESRMRRLNFRLEFVKSLLVPEARLDTSDVALRWAGMPNKNERSITHDVLETLATAGFLAIEEPDRYRVVRGLGSGG